MNPLDVQQSLGAWKIFIAELDQINQRELISIEAKKIFADVDECAIDLRLDDGSPVRVQKLDDVSKVLPDITFRPNRNLIGVVRRQMQKFGVLLRQPDRLCERNQYAALDSLREVFQA